MRWQHTVPDGRAMGDARAASRSDRSVAAAATGTTVCRYCGYHPASTRIFGYCSWDCHDADDEEGEQAA